MKTFLAVFTGNPAAMEKWMQQSEATRNEKEKQGMTAWKTWAEANQKRIVHTGGPLSKTKRVEAAGIRDVRNAMAAFNIVEAENQEEAARMFLNHPHFTIFPGDGVEIMEILPIPNM